VFLGEMVGQKISQGRGKDLLKAGALLQRVEGKREERDSPPIGQRKTREKFFEKIAESLQKA